MNASVHLQSRVQPEFASRDRQLRGKRVAMVTFSPYPFDPRPCRTVDALVREGMTVDLICLGDEKGRWHEYLSGIDILRVPLRNHRGGKLEYAFQYAVFILISSLVFAIRAVTRGYDLVYVHNMPDILILCALVPKALGAKVVLDLHDPMPELMMTIFGASSASKIVRLLRHLERWSLARANLVLTVNLACKQIFASRSCPPEKIGVIMNSPDGEIFQFRAPVLRASAPRFKSDRFVIAYHGSIVERNGLDLAVDALEQVLENFPSAELRIYGYNTPFLERVMDAARTKGLHQAIRHLGPKPLADLAHEIEHCDVGVIPNHRNAFTEINTPIRIFEYLALGKPVIAPRTRGILDYFDDQSILFFEPGDSRELAKQIEYAFTHSREAAEIVRRGQQIYLEHSWERERQTLLSLFSELLKAEATPQ